MIVNVTNIGQNCPMQQLVVVDDSGVIVILQPSSPIDFTGLAVGIYQIYLVCYDDVVTNLAVGNNISTLDGCYGLSNDIEITIESCATNCYYIDYLFCEINPNAGDNASITTTTGNIPVANFGFSTIVTALNNATGDNGWSCINNILVYQGSLEIVSVNFRMFSLVGGGSFINSYPARTFDCVNLPTISCYEIQNFDCNNHPSGEILSIVADGNTLTATGLQFNANSLNAEVQVLVGDSLCNNGVLEIQSFNVLTEITMQFDGQPNPTTFDIVPCGTSPNALCRVLRDFNCNANVPAGYVDQISYNTAIVSGGNIPSFQFTDLASLISVILNNPGTGVTIFSLQCIDGQLRMEADDLWNNLIVRYNGQSSNTSYAARDCVDCDGTATINELSNGDLQVVLTPDCSTLPPPNSTSYQWYIDTGGGFSAISGANSDTVTPTQIGTYRCIVSCGGCIYYVEYELTQLLRCCSILDAFDEVYAHGQIFPSFGSPFVVGVDVELYVGGSLAGANSFVINQSNANTASQGGFDYITNFVDWLNSLAVPNLSFSHVIETVTNTFGTVTRLAVRACYDVSQGFEIVMQHNASDTSGIDAQNFNQDGIISVTFAGSGTVVTDQVDIEYLRGLKEATNCQIQ